MRRLLMLISFVWDKIQLKFMATFMAQYLKGYNIAAIQGITAD